MVVKRLPPEIAVRGEPPTRLRAAVDGDQESLRVWKNANRLAFFHQEEITPQQQRQWYAAYLDRPDDHMYVVEVANGTWRAIGVLGCRLDGDGVDVYNVMRAPGAEAGRGAMGRALDALCDLAAAAYRRPVTCKVLTGNPATRWYEAHGFERVRVMERYSLLRRTRGEGSR